MKCLFCEQDGPYSTVEHIVPESLGNTQILLFEQVCDNCQSYLGKEVEKYVLRRSPIGAWRVFAGIETKHGNPPKFSFQQPNRDKGRLPDWHVANDDSVTLYSSPDGKREFDIDDEEVLKKVAEDSKTDFRLVLTPKMLHMMGRFLGKVGLEMLARDHPEVARDTRFDQMRRFVRFGQPVGFLWPIFHGTIGGPPTAIPCEVSVLDSNVNRETTYTLCILTLGPECWVTCLNDPYPTPEIQRSFPGVEIHALTY
jgi:hypothetical protein